MPACPVGHESSATDFCDTCGVRIGGSTATGTPAASAGTAPAAGGSVAVATDTAAPASEPCPQCGTERSGQFCEGCGFDFSSCTPTKFAASQTAAGGQTAGSGQIPDTGQVPDTGQIPGSGRIPGSGQAPVTTPLIAPTIDPHASGAEPVESAESATAAWSAVATADRAYYETVIEAGGPDAESIQFPGYCPERRFPLAGRELRIGRRSASRGLEPEIDLTGPPADPGISHLHAVLIAEPDGTWSVLDPGSSNGTQVNGAEIVEGVPVPLHDGDRVSLGAWTVLTIHSKAD